MRIIALIALCSFVAFSAFAQEPEVKPQMIEISLDGADFVEASAYVSDIVISVGTAPTEDVSVYVARGVVMGWAAQLGRPDTDKMVTWKFDTGVVPASAQKFRLRYKWSKGPSGSVYSEASTEITLIEAGKPGRPTVIIIN